MESGDAVEHAGIAMNDFFKGFEQLLELAKTLEEKAEKGELKTDIRVNSRSFSNIPRQGNIPDIGVSRIRTPGTGGDDDDGISEEVIVTPPPADQANPTSQPSPAAAPAASTPSPPSPPQPAAPAMPSLKDVGGLAPIIQELKELIEIPLKRPDVLSKLGLEPPRGVMLVGPPGTGKTLTARSLAEELGVSYIAIVGPEIMGKYYGEAEGRLRKVFEKAAKSAPCLIFIDEIDSLAPRSQQSGRRSGKTARGPTAEPNGWLCKNPGRGGVSRHQSAQPH